MRKSVKNFFIRKKIIWLLCYPIAFFSLWLAKQYSFIAEEVFAKKIFKVLSQGIAIFTGFFNFSLAELLIITGPVLFILFLIIHIVKIVKEKENRWYLAANTFLNVFIVLGVFALLYVWGCGVNYYRYPFSYYSNLTIQEASKEELYNLCMELSERTNAARAMLTENENDEGIYTLSITNKELGEKAQKAFKTLSKEYPVFSGIYPATKPVFFSRILSKMEITGIFIPFTMEANVNIDIPHYSIASTMCHELAHLHGFIREDEANYISYLACISSGDSDLIYSGLMEALIISGNALYAKDSELYFSVRETYSEAVVRDMKANSVYWKQFENTAISNAADKVNDTYLKANNQSDGIQSYGRMVDLLLAEYRKNHN